MSSQFRTNARRGAFTLATVVGAYIALRLWRLTDSCLWFDEIFSVHAARHTWSALLSFVAADVIHPPLFYLLLKAWIAIGGESLLWLRLLPALIAIASILPFTLLCRELNLRTSETNLALLLMALSGYLIHYAQTLRMYSLLMFLSICSLWLFAKFCAPDQRSHKISWWLFAINLLLVYTHYYGWVVVGTQAFYVLWRGRSKAISFFASVFALIICFLPWAFVVLRSAARINGLAQNIGWAARPGLQTLAHYYITLNEPLFLREETATPLVMVAIICSFFALLFGYPVLLWIRSELLHSDSPLQSRVRIDALWWIISFSFLPVAVAFLVSQLLPQSVWGIRHLIVVAAPYSILVAVSINRCFPYWAKTAAMLLMGCWLLISGTVLLVQKKEHRIWCAWEQLAQQLTRVESRQESAVKIYTFEDLTAYHLWFALDSAKRKDFQVAVVKHVPGLVEDAAYFLPRDFTAVMVKNTQTFDEDHFWIAFRDAAWNEQRQPVKGLTDQGYTVGSGFTIDTDDGKAFLVPISR